METSSEVRLCRKLAALLGGKRKSSALLNLPSQAGADEEALKPMAQRPAEPEPAEGNIEGLAMLTSLLTILAFLASVATDENLSSAAASVLSCRIGSMVALLPLAALLVLQPKGYVADLVALALAAASLLHMFSVARALIEAPSLHFGDTSGWLGVYPAAVSSAFELICASGCLAASVGGLRSSKPHASSEGLAMLALLVTVGAGASIQLAALASLGPASFLSLAQVAAGGYGAGFVGCLLGFAGFARILASQTVSQPLLVVAAVLHISSSFAILAHGGASFFDLLKFHSFDLGSAVSVVLLLTATGLELALASF